MSGLFYLFTHLHLLSSNFFSSLTLPTSAFPSVHIQIVRSLTSKFPSIKIMMILEGQQLGSIGRVARALPFLGSQNVWP